MNHPMTLTLAAWQDWIWIVVMAAVMLGSALSNLKKKSQEQRKRDEGDSVQDLEQMAARRREELRQATRSPAQATMRPGGQSGGAEPGNLTMAERIARARAKAQYEQRAQAGAQRGQPAMPQEPNEAQRRALAQRRAEIERRQQAANAQQQAQQRARQQAQQQARLKAQQQAQARARAQAQAHARAQAQARQRGTLLHEQVVTPEPTESTTRRLVTDATTSKRSSPIDSVLRPRGSVIGPGASISRNDLRKAIIFKEVLGQPVALRDSEAF